MVKWNQTYDGKNLLPQNRKCKVYISGVFCILYNIHQNQVRKIYNKKLLQKFVSHLMDDGFILHTLPLMSSYGPRHEKTCLRSFRQGEIQTSLLSHRA